MSKFILIKINLNQIELIYHLIYMKTGDDIIKEININVKKDITKVNSEFKFKNLIILFSIIGSCVGTAIALSTANIMKEITKSIISPLIDLTIGQLLPFHLLKFTVSGKIFSFEKILYELSSFGILLLIIYLVFKYFLKDIISSAIEDKHSGSIKTEKQNNAMIKVLHSIDNKLSAKSRTEIPNQLDEIHSSIKTISEQNTQYIPYSYAN